MTRQISKTTVAVLAGAVLFGTAFAMPTDAMARGYTLPGWDSCHRDHCERTNITPGLPATGDDTFPSVCNGEVGTWIAIPLPNDKTFCVAKSIAAMSNTGSAGSSSCTVGHVHRGTVISETTSSGGCSEHRRGRP